jgi:hypothetical protein
VPIQTILDLSTAHMTYNDSLLLGTYKATGDQPDDASLVAYPYEYGWTVSTGPLNDQDDADNVRAAMLAEGFSEHFVAVLDKAMAANCVLVRFDRDAMREPGLPTFNWEAEMETGDVTPEAEEPILGAPS